MKPTSCTFSNQRVGDCNNKLKLQNLKEAGAVFEVVVLVMVHLHLHLHPTLDYHPISPHLMLHHTTASMHE